MVDNNLATVLVGMFTALGGVGVGWFTFKSQSNKINFDQRVYYDQMIEKYYKKVEFECEQLEKKYDALEAKYDKIESENRLLKQTNLDLTMQYNCLEKKYLEAQTRLNKFESELNRLNYPDND